MIILTSSFFHPLYGNCAVYNETISKHLLRFHDSYIFLEFYFEMPSFFTTFFRALAKVNFTLQAENVDLHKDMLAWLKSFAGVKKMEEVKEQQRQNTNTGTSLDEKYYLLNSFGQNLAKEAAKYKYDPDFVTVMVYNEGSLFSSQIVDMDFIEEGHR